MIAGRPPLLTVLLALMLAACAADPPPDVDRSDPETVRAVGRLADRYLAETPLVGLSVAVARDGRIVHEAGYGLARRAPDMAADASVPFELYSIAKPVTAVLLLELAERGLVDLDEPAGNYLEALPAPYGSATLRQLLHGSSGVAGIAIDELAPEPRYASAPSRDALLGWLANGSQVAVPDETWTDASSAYVAAGLVAEAVAHRTLAELVRDEMALPLDLGGLARCPDLTSTRADAYVAASGTTMQAPRIDAGWRGGGGALCGATGDIARWWLAVRSGRILAPASLQDWTEPLELTRNGVTAQFGYGLGIQLGAWRGHTVIGHVGEGGGGSAVLAEYPDDRLLIVVATNTSGQNVPHAIEIQAAIAAELLGLVPVEAANAIIEPAALATVPGLYRSPKGSFCVEARAEQLAVSTDEKQTVELSYLGGGRFVRPGDADAIEYFLGWPDRSEWLAYAWLGLPMDLARKEADFCP